MLTYGSLPCVQNAISRPDMCRPQSRPITVAICVAWAPNQSRLLGRAKSGLGPPRLPFEATRLPRRPRTANLTFMLPETPNWMHHTYPHEKRPARPILLGGCRLRVQEPASWKYALRPAAARGALIWGALPLTNRLSRGEGAPDQQRHRLAASFSIAVESLMQPLLASPTPTLTTGAGKLQARTARRDEDAPAGSAIASRLRCRGLPEHLRLFALVEGALRPEPQRRPGARGGLTHPWHPTNRASSLQQRTSFLLKRHPTVPQKPGARRTDWRTRTNTCS